MEFIRGNWSHLHREVHAQPDSLQRLHELVSLETLQRTLKPVITRAQTQEELGADQEDILLVPFHGPSV